MSFKKKKRKENENIQRRIKKLEIVQKSVRGISNYFKSFSYLKKKTLIGKQV